METLHWQGEYLPPQPLLFIASLKQLKMLQRRWLTGCLTWQVLISQHFAGGNKVLNSRMHANKKKGCNSTGKNAASDINAEYFPFAFGSCLYLNTSGKTMPRTSAYRQN
jgi:hypothetical protein